MVTILEPATPSRSATLQIQAVSRQKNFQASLLAVSSCWTLSCHLTIHHPPPLLTSTWNCQSNTPLPSSPLLFTLFRFAINNFMKKKQTNRVFKLNLISAWYKHGTVFFTIVSVIGLASSLYITSLVTVAAASLAVSTASALLLALNGIHGFWHMYDTSPC